MEKFPPQQQETRAITGKLFESMAAEIPGVRVMPARRPLITRWSFYNYLLAIDPDAFGGATKRWCARRWRPRASPPRSSTPP